MHNDDVGYMKLYDGYWLTEISNSSAGESETIICVSFFVDGINDRSNISIKNQKMSEIRLHRVYPVFLFSTSTIQIFQ